jgi:uncharacterized protein (DUF885 family)
MMTLLTQFLQYILYSNIFCLLLIFLSAEVTVNEFGQKTDLPLLIQTFDQDESVLNRYYNIRYSDEYFDRFERFYSEWLNRLQGITFNDLNHESRIDYLLLQNHIRRAAYFLENSRENYEEIVQWMPDMDSIMDFINERRAGNKPDAQQVATMMTEWTDQIESLKDRLNASGPLNRFETVTATDALENIRDVLSDAYTFYDGYDIEFTWWVEQPYQKLDETLESYISMISEHFDAEAEQLDDSGIVGNPIGRDEIIQRLEFEMISYSPQELIDIAEHQFARAEQEMLRASHDLGYANDWHAALEHVKNRYVEPGKKPELIKYLADEAIEFVQERNLLTVPELAKEIWRMRMMTPDRQLINPFFTGGEVISISYPTNTMAHEAKLMSLRGNNPHFNRATVQHELIPGHHLQGFMNRRYKTYRSPFRTPFWGEGWALYWEMVLWDIGFAETPEDRIGMLFWRSHRYARIIFSLNYHLGNWTPQQCIDYLVERVGHEYANAEAEVRRSFAGNYDPMYQIAYMIGGMQIHALYKDLVDTGEMSNREFHDTILQNGSIPIRMVRSILTNEPLHRDGVPDWSFADYIYE